MIFLKKVYRQTARILNSLIVYAKIYLYTKANYKQIDNLFKMNFDDVHVVCPGPSAAKLVEQNFDENSAIIFVNHAVKLASQVKGSGKLFYFSADVTRTSEVLIHNHEEIKKCFSILAPWHLFQIKKFSLFKGLNILLLPKTRMTSKYGLETVNNGPHNFSKLTKTPNGSGFGTFVYSLKLAILFSPKRITLWGSDFGNKDGMKYFDEKTPIRNDTPFELIKKHFYIIKDKINDLGIEVI